jgi:hypothetical protein
MRRYFLSAVILLNLGNCLNARDCSLSKEFEIKKAQEFAGVLQDETGAPLPGIELRLLSGKHVIQRLTTTNQGTYDFGQIAPGKYRFRVRYAGGAFCAPKVQCTEEKGCVIESRVAVSSNDAVLVQ